MHMIFFGVLLYITCLAAMTDQGNDGGTGPGLEQRENLFITRISSMIDSKLQDFKQDIANKTEESIEELRQAGHWKPDCPVLKQLSEGTQTGQLSSHVLISSLKCQGKCMTPKVVSPKGRLRKCVNFWKLITNSEFILSVYQRDTCYRS